MKLYKIAHSKSAGGESNTQILLSLVPFKEEHYEVLRAQVTAAKVREHLKDIVKGEVVRYELPVSAGFLFVCERVMGVSTLDVQGPMLSDALLTMELDEFESLPDQSPL